MWVKAGIVTAVVAASVVAPLVVRQRTETEWREKEARLRQQAEQLEVLTAENRRLSNIVARVRSAPSPANGRLRELLRLRGEIGQLRQAVSEMEKLRVVNQRLRAVPGMAPGEVSASLPPEGQTVQAHWPKAELAAAGYGEPASALKTALWAMTRGDGDALATSVTPEARAKLERQDWLTHKSPVEELADRGKWIAESLGPASGFAVVGRKETAQDRAILDVYFEGEGKTRKFEMKKVGGEWKLSAMGLSGGKDDEFSAGWP